MRIILALAGMTLLMIVTTSCASSQTRLQRPLESRTLWIDESTLDRFYYCGNVCTRKLLGVCASRKYVCEHYPFENKEVIKTLLDKGFVLKVFDK